nr:hypothetical protein [Novosphingobium sp.]
MCRQAGSSPTIISSRSSKGSDYAEVPHGGWPENKVLANAMRHNPGYGIMNHFMRQNRIKGLRAAEGLEGGRRDKVAAGIVAGHIAAEPHLGRQRGEEGLGVRDALFLGQDRCRRGFVAIDLRCIEHTKGTGDETAARVLVAALVIAGRAKGLPQKDDGRASAALNLSAALLPLAVGAPDGGRIARVLRLGPEEQDIDAPIRLAGDIDRAGCARAVPGHLVCASTRLDGRDDLLGHLLEKAGHERPPDGGGSAWTCRSSAGLALPARQPR